MFPQSPVYYYPPMYFDSTDSRKYEGWDNKNIESRLLQNP
jgi:hypothetical protein